MDFNTYILLYGDFPELHNAVLGDVLKRFPKEALQNVTVWCNQVCRPTLDFLKTTPFTAIESKDNVPKYPAMRWIFERRQSTPWILWLDDDTRIVADDWWAKTEAFFASHPTAVYVGQLWTCTDLAKRQDFVRAATWYKGKPWMLLNNVPGVNFAVGGFWWLQDGLRRRIDWPDRRLRHCGGDTLLAEAVRQQGFELTHFTYGVKTQQNAHRRGLVEKPAGWGGYTPPATRINESKLTVWRGNG
jgi:hypothetical protein